MMGDATMRTYKSIVVTKREFITYGVGVSLMQMRNPETAMGRAPVASA